MKRILSFMMIIAVTAAMLCGCRDTKKASSNSSSLPDKTVSSDSLSGEKPEVKPLLKDKEGSFKAGDVLNGENGRITNLSFATDSFKLYDKIELKTDITGLSSGLNVFDEKDVDLSITLKTSTGKTITLPAFYYEGFKFDENGKVLGADGSADFRFRISLTEAASWDFVITLKIKGETVDTVSGYINAEENTENHGYLKVEQKRRQNFCFTDGTSYTAIGENICSAHNSYATASTRGAKMIEWMKSSADYGANFTRVWLYQWGLYLQAQGSAPDDLTAGMNNAAQLDKIFEAWEDMGMYGQLCMFTFNQLKNDPDSQESGWSAFPYNAANKNGYLKNPIDFFTDEQAIEDTKIYFRYLIARYSYSTNLHSWEFFNEVDLANDYTDNFESVVEWHKLMTEYIRSIDPYGHMITTSTASKEDVLNSYSIFDFASIHWYNYNNLKELADYQLKFWQTNSRPIMLGEVGIMSVGLDADLVTLHQQNWLGVMGCGAGTGATWYWETLDELGGYWDYQVISEMANHIPWDSDTLFTLSTDNIKPSDESVGAMGYRGKDFVYLWLYDMKFTQQNKNAGNISNLSFSLKLNDGQYHVRWINTWTGVSISQTVEEAVDGVLELEAPVWSKDVALAVTVD